MRTTASVETASPAAEEVRGRAPESGERGVVGGGRKRPDPAQPAGGADQHLVGRGPADESAGDEERPSGSAAAASREAGAGRRPTVRTVERYRRLWRDGCAVTRAGSRSSPSGFDR